MLLGKAKDGDSTDVNSFQINLQDKWFKWHEKYVCELKPTHCHVCVKLGKLSMYTKRQGTRCMASICEVCHSAALLLTVVSETSWPSMHLRFCYCLAQRLHLL